MVSLTLGLGEDNLILQTTVILGKSVTPVFIFNY